MSISDPRSATIPAAAGWRSRSWLLAPVAVGVFLRLFRLRSQLLLGDELHAPRIALKLDLGDLLTTYLPVDFCMPLTALYKLLMNAGVELGELQLRLPVLIAGVLALVVVPVALERRLGSAVGRGAAWLVALSPGLVLYSRIVRSYMPMTLLGFVAVMAFERWWSTRRTGPAVAYLAAGAAAVWFHLGSAPFVAAPLLWGAVAGLRRPARWRDLGSLALLGLGLVAGWAAFLVPAWSSFVALLADKSGGGLPDLGGFGEVAKLQAGASATWAAVLFWALAAVGLATLARRRPRLASYTALLVAVDLAAVLVLAPAGIANPLILNRYLLVVLPLVLAWVAVGLAWLAAALGKPGRPAAAALVALLVLGGPLLDRRVLYSSFLQGNAFLTYSRPVPQLAAGVTVSRFYRRLAAAPDEQPVIEATSLPTWLGTSELRIYQDVHHQRVLLSPQEPRLFAGGLALHNYVEPAARAFLAAPARWLVLHRRSVWELDRVETVHGVGIHVPPAARPISRRIARHLSAYLERLWGPPDFTDAVVQVWDLERLRAAAGRAQAADSTRSPPAALAR